VFQFEKDVPESFGLQQRAHFSGLYDEGLQADCHLFFVHTLDSPRLAAKNPRYEAAPQ
jgi:hypothetical protein